MCKFNAKKHISQKGRGRHYYCGLVTKRVNGSPPLPTPSSAPLFKKNRTTKEAF